MFYHQHFEVTTSTMDEASKLISSGQELPFIITATRQTQGRGRVGKKWISEKTGNLYMSLAIKSPEPRFLSILPMALPGAIANALDIYDNKLISFKWPNDILFDNKKIGGVLMERCENKIIIGIGINVNYTPNVFDAPTSCLLEAGIIDKALPEDKIKEIADQIAKETMNDISRMEINSDMTIEIWRRKEWKKRGENIILKIKDQRIHCNYLGIDNKGQIIIENEEGQRKYSYGDVSYFDE